MKIAAFVLLSVLAFGVNREGVAADVDKSAENAALIRAHHDALNRGDWKNALTYFAEDTKNFGRPVGRQRVGMVLEDIWTTFPDFASTSLTWLRRTMWWLFVAKRAARIWEFKSCQ